MNEISIPEELSADNLSREERVECIRTLVSMGQRIVLKTAEEIWKLRNDFFSGKDEHKEFVAYCREEFGISPTSVSKYETIGDNFYAHGYEPESFKFLEAGREKYKDYEVVYEAAKTEGTPEEKFSRSITWSRSDFKDEKADDPNHTHTLITICGGNKDSCGKRIYEADQIA